MRGAIWPDRCQSIRVRTAKVCLRSVARGWTVSVRSPSRVVSVRSVLARPLRSSAVPMLEMKNVVERGRGHSRSRAIV